MGGRLSKEKGKRGEREVVKILQEAGFVSARRTAQHRGKPFAGQRSARDVECEELSNLHIEVKLRAKFTPQTIRDAVLQARRDGLGLPSCVVWRSTHQPEYKAWRVSWILPNGRIATSAEDIVNVMEVLNASYKPKKIKHGGR